MLKNFLLHHLLLALTFVFAIHTLSQYFEDSGLFSIVRGLGNLFAMGVFFATSQKTNYQSTFFNIYFIL